MARKHNIILSLLIACSLYVSLFLVYQTKSSIHSKNNTTSRKPDESSPSALLLIGAGNVGYPLLHALALDSKTSNTFSKIIILDAQPEKPDEIQFLQQELHMEYKYIQGDMRDEFLLHQIFNETHIKGVIVLAAVSRVMWCEIEKETCQQINTHAIRILMKQITLSNSNPWIIFASSREVYGAVKEFPITETTPMNPLNLYGRTKMKAEHILTSYNKKPLHKIILRFSSIYGGKYDHSDRLIPSMIRSMLNDQPIPFSGSNQEFDFTYIDDVVDAIKLAIHQAEELTSSSVDIGTLTKYNICSGELTSVKLYQIIKYLTNSYSPVIMFDNNGVFPDKYEASTKYTAEKLGFKARVNIRNGLSTYIHQIYTISHQQLRQQLKISTSFNENEDMKSLDECSVIFNFKNQAHEFNLKVFKENNTVVIPVLDVGPKTITENNKTIVIESGPSKFIIKVDSFSKSLVLLDAKEPSKYYEMDKKSSTEWDSKSYPYKIHIHCCPNLVNHPFSSFSPYFLSNIDYPQRNNPTLSNAKLEQAIKYKTHEIQRLFDLRIGKLEEDGILSNYSMNANDWTQSSKDNCETNCNNIIPCLKRDNCRCVINEQCSHSSMTIPSFITSSPLYDQRLSLLSVYGRSLGMKWPKIYVHDFNQTLKFLSNSNCGKKLTTEKHCFSMDAVLYYSFKNISVPIEEADVVMLPYFHGCSHHYGLQIAIDSYILKELDNLKAKYPNKIFTTMASHDYGGCGEFWWSYLDVNNPKQKESHFKMVTIQPNGDYFSKCYIPEKDIVAPPRTCLTNRLIEKFGNETSVKKVTERKHLVFFEGSLFGTGKVTRKTLKECSNVFGFIPKNQYSDYLEMLSETKFCPLVAGTTGWATRNSDVIYAGCIPVYLSEYTHQPFANLLDYSKFSIHLHPSQVYNLKSILESISEERMIELQRNLLMIRDLMIYKNEESVKEWSPQDMVLRELYIRLKTRFETK